MALICRCFLFGLILTFSGCQDETHSPSIGEEAGSDAARLSLELSIGDAGDAPREYQFASVVDIVVSQDGTIWVLDGDGTVTGGQTPLLRQYDSEGRFLRQVGGEGSGPGEYRAPSGLALLPDGRVALRDFTLADRLTLFLPDGSFDVTWPIPDGLFWNFRASGAIQVDLCGVSWLRFKEARRAPPNRLMGFLRLRPDGSVVDTVPLPQTPEVERDVVEITRPLPSGGIEVRSRFIVPYQPRGIWSWSPFGTFAVARTDQYRIEHLPPPDSANVCETTDRGEEVSREMVFSRDLPPVPVPEGERSAAHRGLEERVNAAEGGRGLRIPEVPTHKPPIRSVGYSEDGRLLVAVAMPSRFEDGEWTETSAIDVFEQDGIFLGRVIMPSSFSGLFMRGDHIWGVFLGEYGVESVRRYRILWPD